MMLVTMIGLIVASYSDEADLQADQFARLMTTLHQDVEDLSFLYEGEMRWIGSSRILGRDPDRFGGQFQGTYFYRHDGAEALDVYKKRDFSESSPVTRRIVTCLNGALERTTFSPDQSDRPLIQRGSCGPGSLSGPDSPNVLNYYWYFYIFKNAKEWGYQFLGWEDVDSHRCLKVRFNRTPGPEPHSENFRIFWIDVERGGHPLKVEDYRDSRLLNRVDNIVLKSYQLPDETHVWLPIRCVLEGFRWEENYYRSPLMRETLTLVGGSVLINQGLPDEVFSVAYHIQTPNIAALRELRQELEAMSIHQEWADTPPSPPTRTDRDGVQERLDQMLAEADRQARMLEASSPARRFWSGTLIAQIVFGVVGIALITTALIWMWRGR